MRKPTININNLINRLNPKIVAVIGTIIVLAFVSALIYTITHNQKEVKIRDFQIKTMTTEKEELKTHVHELKLDYERARLDINTSKEELQKKDDLIKEQEKQLKEKDAALQAKAEAKRQEAERIAAAARLEAAKPKVVAAAAPAPAKPSPSGTKYDWMRAAGIPESDWPAVDSIVRRESGWDPCAYYPGRSNCNANPTTACGLAQSLPCGKQAKYGHWTDPVANLKWQYDYVRGKYGGYWGAYRFWNANHWY